MKVTLKTTGGPALAKALRALPDRVSNRVMKAALLNAGRPIRDAAAQKAPRRPGAPDIAANIGMHPARAERAGEVAVLIGPTIGFFYGSFLEFGTSKMQAQPFMRPAFEAGWQRALNTMNGLIWGALARDQGVGASPFNPSRPVGAD